MRTIIETYRGVEIWDDDIALHGNIEKVREYIDNIWETVFV